MKFGLKDSPEINASSMADIAFLLLIFFLVTTTMDIDKGILAMLPPAVESEPIPFKERNVLEVFLNDDNQLMVENDWVEMEELNALVYTHITNEGLLDEYAESSKKAVVSLKNGRQTTYENYIGVYNEIRAAYNQARNEFAQNQFNKNFNDLLPANQKIVKEKYPLKLSEAEFAIN